MRQFVNILRVRTIIAYQKLDVHFKSGDLRLPCLVLEVEVLYCNGKRIR